MLKAIALIGALLSPAASAATEATYIARLNAYTLGYPHVEFYHAYVVTTMPLSRLNELPSQLQKLCSEFPRIPQYKFVVTNSSSLSNDPAFEKLALNLVLVNQNERAKFKENILAEYGSGTLTLLPLNETERKTITLGTSWCAPK